MPESRKKNIASIVSGYGRRLFRFVRGRVNSEEDAEDIMQDIWYQLSRLTNLDDLENAGAWLYRVARNKISDLYRRRQPHHLEQYGYEDEEGEWQFKDILLMDAGGDPDLALFKDLFWRELLAALDELPENQRQVFILNELEDLTLQEIADQTGENLKTIISRKGYALKHLRKKLAYLYQELNL